MKYNRYLSMIMVLITVIFVFVSCMDGTGNKISNTSAPTNETPVQDTNILTENKFVPEPQNIVMIDRIYFNYETSICYAEHVIEAKYEGVEYYKRYCEYKFLVEKQYKGHIEEEYVYVQSVYSINSVSDTFGNFLTYKTYDTSFDKGESYILILDSVSWDIYDPHRPYLLSGDIIIPVENVSKSTMYGGQPLSEHSSMSKEDLSEYGLFIEYLKTRINEYDLSKEPVDVKVITSEKIEDVVENSDYIVKVKIVKADGYVFDEREERYSCEILTEYKGTLEDKSVRIHFFPGTVKVGKEYIVAINSITPNIDDLFYLSSKNSLFSVERENEIIELTGNTQNQ